MSFRMKKVMSFEIADEFSHDGYMRYTIRVDLRKVSAALLAAVIVCLVFVFGFDYNKHVKSIHSGDQQLYTHHYYDELTAPTHFSPYSRESYAAKPSNGLLATTTDTSKYQTNAETDRRRQFVKNMATEAWNAYKTYAFGANNLKPTSQSSDRHGAGTVSAGGLTLIKSMSTLWVMGLKDEFELGRQWVRNKFDFVNSNNHAYVFVAATEYLGSFLACYALTNDTLFLMKAREVAKALEPSFSTKTGVPNKNIYPASGNHEQDNHVHLAEAGGQHLEFLYIAHLTKDKELAKKIRNARKHLTQMNKPKGLYISDLYTDQNKWMGQQSTLFWPANVFYQYLVKSYIQSNGRDVEALEMYQQAMDAVERNKLITSSKSGSFYARSFYTESKRYSDYMTYDGCALGGMFALGAHALEANMALDLSMDIKLRRDAMDRVNRHWQLADELTETCHGQANGTKTGLPPTQFVLDSTRSSYYSNFDLTADLVESYFILWRLTHDPKYRNYAWEFAQAIAKHCRTEDGGYAQLYNVHSQNGGHHNHQPSHFLSTTLKYLYLIFSDDTTLPQDQWVFNRVGQPLPICGHNKAYADCIVN